MGSAKMFGLSMLKGYITFAIGILVIVGYIILSGIGTAMDMGYIVLAILMILMIGSMLLSSIIQIHIFEEISEIKDELLEEEE